MAEYIFEINDVLLDEETGKAVMKPKVKGELIRCKDCKHSDHWYKDKRRCFLWHEAGIDVFEDGYCSYAERREE